MTLIEALNSLPHDMVLRSHLNQKQRTVQEWIITLTVTDLVSSGYEVGDSTRNYGKVKVKSIYCKSGVVFSGEVK